MSWYDKYLQVYEQPYEEERFKDVVSEVRGNMRSLQSEAPLVTLSVIAYNEERRLLACLWALSDLRTKYPVEIIGVNNDSKDKTEKIFQDVGIPFYTEYQHSCGYARLCGLTHAKGKYHINVDADTLYPPTYVDAVIDLMERSSDVVGVSANWGYLPVGNISKWNSWLYESFRNLYLRMQAVKRPELSVRGLVFSYRTEEARKVGIRVHIIRGEDGALAFGLREYGKIVFTYNRKARAMTGQGTVGSKGLWNSFWIRFRKIMGGYKLFFTSAKEYKDQDDNLIDKH